MRSFDVAIIGGGVIGAAIAREVSRYKIRTVLFEKEEEMAFGVSKSNSGIIHPGTQNPPDSLKGRLCVQGNSMIREIANDLGVDFKEVGELITIFSEDDMPHLMKLKKEGEMLGVPGLTIVKSEWLRRNEPNLNKEVVAALYAPTAGIISPYRLVYDLSENAKKNGVHIFTSTKVNDIKHTARSRTKFEIYTSKGIFKSRFVVNAAGLYADQVASMVDACNFKIVPRKGEEFILDKKNQYLTNHLIFPLPEKRSKGVLIIRTSDGNPMIGPTAEEVKDIDDLATTDEGFKKVITSARKMIPSIDEGDIISYFAGLRPAAGDDFIIRHETKVKGFINVAGIQSPGLTAAPAIGRMIIDMLWENGLTVLEKRKFNRYRKKTIHLFDIPLSKTKKLIEKDPAYGDIVCRCEMVSAKEVKDAISRGANTLDGIKFRTRAQSGRCHGSFCTTRLMKILNKETGKPIKEITKRGPGSEIIKKDRADG